jgi:hypothetical protein
MQQHLFNILNDADLSAALSMHGRQTILSRHTCIHRVDELLDICASLGIVQHVDETAHLPTA